MRKNANGCDDSSGRSEHERSSANGPHCIRGRQRLDIDVQALTCAALAGTWQGDADRLTTWYSGWYNGLAKKHYFNIARSKELEHEVIVYCKANPEVRIIEAIGVLLKQERFMSGFK